MIVILLEAAGALLLLLLIVWWTMFSGRDAGEPRNSEPERSGTDRKEKFDAQHDAAAAAIDVGTAQPARRIDPPLRDK